MNYKKVINVYFLMAALLITSGLFLLSDSNAANHREAPITAIDRTADITDWFAFRSYEPGRENTLTMILGVDPFLEPSNGPNYFPFDPGIVYTMNLDNDRDGEDDLIWEFRFTTETRLPGVFTGFVGAGAGVNAPANAPLALDGTSTVGAPIVPPAITALNGPGSEGLSLRQTFTVTVLNGAGAVLFFADSDADGNPLIAVPSNVGPRTMPNYSSLASQGIFTLSSSARVFAGTVDDPFYIDLGAAFDSLNFLFTPVLTPEQDADDTLIVDGARDDVSGFNVNVIAFEVPIDAVTVGDGIPAATSADAVVGTYGATFRSENTVLNAPGEAPTLSGDLVQIQRMGNPLINELIIGTGFKDLFSMSEPSDDVQFAGGDPSIPNFLLDPVAARVLNAVFEISVPNPPRIDLAPLVFYTAPICPGCDLTANGGLGEGPLAELLRVNLGFAPLTEANSSRLGFIVDGVGHPNGRRVFEDVTDIFLRVGAGLLAGAPFNAAPNSLLGDGVNRNDLAYQPVFPYVAFAQSGRDSRHIDRGEPVSLSGDGDGDGDTGGDGNGCNSIIGSVSAGSALGAILIPGIAMAFLFGRRFTRRKK
ncbi:MAG: DUF4331 domain-containing protein [Thermodesulfobacteriota bacterium]